MKEKPAYAELSRDELVARLQALEQAESERIRLLHDLEVHQVELEQQNQELRETQSALEFSRSRYADLFDLAPLGHLVLNLRGRIRQANLSAGSLLGRKREALAGRYLADFLDPASQEHLGDLLWRARQGQPLRGTELRTRHGPEPVILSVRCGALPAAEDARELLHLSLMDVSAERRAEARLALFAHTTLEGVVFSEHGRILDCNRQFAELLGYSPEALKGQPIAPLIAPGDRERVMENIRRERDSDLEHALLRRDGEYIRVTVRGRPDPQAGAGRRISIMRDVSELGRTRDLLQLVTDSAPLLIAYVDREQRYRMVNTGYRDRFGKSREQLLGSTVREVLGEEAYAKVRGHIEQALAGERQNFEDWFSFPGQEEGHFSVSYIPHGEGVGRVSGFVAVVQDTTERKRSELALRESELFHRQALESIPGMVFTTRPDGFCDYQSQQWVEYTAVPMSEQLGDGWNRLLHPQDAPRALAAWREAVAGGAPYELDYRLRRRDGAYEWFHVVGRPIRAGDGAVARWFGVAVNIERLKRAEERSRKFTFLVENSQEFIGMADLGFHPAYLNPAALRMVGLTDGALEAVGSIAEIVHADDRDFLRDDFMPRVLREGRAEAEMRFRHFAGGEARWMLCAAFVLRDARGDPTGYATVSRDITHRREAEAERLATLEQQRDALVREVHHRIKNHLQGVTGLLGNRAAENPELAGPLRETIAQVRTIAGVYGLQSRRNDARVLLGELIEAVAGAAAGEVEYRSPEGDGIALSQEEAVPIALVVNELITNALKHRDGGGRAVRVGLARTGEGLRTTVRGGPARLPEGLDLARGRGMGTGLELVASLLPPRGAVLGLRQEGDEVVAELVLREPVLQA